MLKKFQKLAVALLLLGLSGLPAKAATLYETLSVQLVLTYQEEAATNSTTGQITDSKAMRSVSTSGFLQLLATNLGITLDRGASLMRVTTLITGTNYTTFLTNATSLQPGYTLFETLVVPTNYIYYTNASNGFLFVTNPSTMAPPAGYTLYDAPTNLGVQTNYIQGKGYAVIVGTNVRYYIHNAASFSDTNFDDISVWVPLFYTNNNVTVTISTLDEAPNFQNIEADSYITVADTNLLYISSVYPYFSANPPETNFYMASIVTNLNYNVYGSSETGPIFVGTIKTNGQISGSLEADTISITVRNPYLPVGAPAPLSMNVYGTADATTVTGSVGSGRSAMPFSSWNATFDIVSGSGTLGGTVTNVIATNFIYYSGTNTPESRYTDSTNPPVTFSNIFYDPAITNTVTNIYTNLGTNYSTNFNVLNATNTSFTITGTVKQSTYKIGSP